MARWFMLRRWLELASSKPLSTDNVLLDSVPILRIVRREPPSETESGADPKARIETIDKLTSEAEQLLNEHPGRKYPALHAYLKERIVELQRIKGVYEKWSQPPTP